MALENKLKLGAAIVSFGLCFLLPQYSAFLLLYGVFNLLSIQQPNRIEQKEKSVTNRNMQTSTQYEYAYRRYIQRFTNKLDYPNLTTEKELATPESFRAPIPSANNKLQKKAPKFSDAQIQKTLEEQYQEYKQQQFKKSN